MSRKWHPDKYKDEEDKHQAQEKFIEIQKACDILNKIRQRRTEKSMKSEKAKEETYRTFDKLKRTDL